MSCSLRDQLWRLFFPLLISAVQAYRDGAAYGCGVSQQNFPVVHRFTAPPLRDFLQSFVYALCAFSSSSSFYLQIQPYPKSLPRIKTARSTPTTPAPCPLDLQPHPGSSPIYLTLSRPPLPQHQHPPRQPR